MSYPKIKSQDDSRITLRFANLNGYTYGYIHSLPDPPTKVRATIILIHGFPDISFGWRYQIPYLTSLGLEVIALDCLGYGRSDSPPSTELSAYTYRRVSDDIKELCRQLGLSSVILGGHDWGGAIVYRVALYNPNLVKAFFAVCTPYQPPSPKYAPLQLITETALPNFKYQIHFASGDVEKNVRSPAEIRRFLHALYGARGPQRELGFIPEEGVLFDNLPKMGTSRLIDEDEMDLYVREYSRHGINGPLNWYRTRELNYVDEWEAFFGKGTKNMTGEVKVQGVEVLFVQATKDQALKPFMARKMGERVERLRWEKVEAGHWALWEKPEEVNGIIGRWLNDKVFGKGSKL